MKGAGQILAPVLILTAAATLGTIILACSYTGSGLPIFDVPPCKGSTCVSKAFPVKDSYASWVGKTWSLINEFQSDYLALRAACSLNFVDENGKPITKNIKKVIKAAFGLRSELYTIADLSRISNEYGLVEIQNLISDLERAGVSETTEADWLGLYSDVRMALEDMERGTTRTELGRYWRIVGHGYLDNGRSAGLVGTIMRTTLYLVDRVVRIPMVFLKIPILTEGAMTSSSLQADYIYDYINASVGYHNSVRSYIGSLFDRYLSYKRALDGRVKETSREIDRIYSKLRDELGKMRDENLSEISRFLPSKVYVGELTTKTSFTPAYALALASDYYRRFRIAKSDYEAGNGFLSAFERMKRAESNIMSLKEEVDTFLTNIGHALDGCRREVKSHHFKDTTLKVMAYTELYRAGDDSYSLTLRVSACRKALEYLEEDEKKGSLLSAYEDCKKEYEKRWNERLPCEGNDPALLLSCCETRNRQKESELYSSEEYLQYLDMYNTVEDVSIQQGLVDILSDLYTLPRKPYNRTDLMRSYSKILALLDRLSKEASVNTLIEWNGYLSTEEIGDVYLTIKNPLSLPVRGEVTIPFRFYGFSVEGNDLHISVEGDTVKYSGKGTATVRFQAQPVDLEEKILSNSNGTVKIRLRNPYILPVKSYASFRVLSYGDGAYFSDNYLYLSPGASAVVEIPALDIRTEVSGDMVAFVVTNTSPYRYDGTVTLDANAEKVYTSSCFSTPTHVICRVRLDPGEETLIKVRGYLLPSSDVSFSPPEKKPVLRPAIEDMPPVENETTTEQRFTNLLNKLQSYWKRAVELGVQDILPFNEETLNNIRSLDKDLRGAAVPLLSSLDEEVRSNAETRTVLLEKVAEVSDNPDLTSAAKLARRSLLSGDYITPLALSKGINRYFERESADGHMDMTVLLVAIAGAIGALLFNRIRLSEGKRRKRIPRF